MIIHPWMWGDYYPCHRDVIQSFTIIHQIESATRGQDFRAHDAGGPRGERPLCSYSLPRKSSIHALSNDSSASSKDFRLPNKAANAFLVCDELLMMSSGFCHTLQTGIVVALHSHR